MKCVLCGSTHFSRIHNLGKCTTCGLVQVVPMPGAQEIRALYHEDLEHFEPYIAQIPVHREYFRKKIREINSQFTIHNSQFRLLDIGCAMGILLEEARRVGIRATGIDISHDAVVYCRKKKLDVLEGTLSSIAIKLKKNSFDVVTAFEIIEHERNPLDMMRCIHSLLKKSGVAVATTPNHNSFWRKIMGRWWVGYHHPEHVTFWDTESLRELFGRAGFKNIQIRRDCPRPFPLSFVFTRGADYVPWMGWFLRPFGKLLTRWNIINPINPWDDLIVYGRK